MFSSKIIIQALQKKRSIKSFKKSVATQVIYQVNITILHPPIEFPSYKFADVFKRCMLIIKHIWATCLKKKSVAKVKFLRIVIYLKREKSPSSMKQ